MSSALRKSAAWLWPVLLVFGAILYRVNQDGSCRRRPDLRQASGSAPDRRVRTRSSIDPTSQAYLDWLLQRTHAWAQDTRQAELAAALTAARRSFRAKDCDRAIPAARELGRRLRTVTAWPKVIRKPGDPRFPSSSGELIGEVDAMALWICPDYRPW